jgi:hypothetical protein
MNNAGPAPYDAQAFSRCQARAPEAVSVNTR